MSATVTLRVSDAVMERLRRQSQAEGRSLNETAVRALVAGLDEPKESWWPDLGAMIQNAFANSRRDYMSIRRTS
jgi:hypothetical protein